MTNDYKKSLALVPGQLDEVLRNKALTIPGGIIVGAAFLRNVSFARTLIEGIGLGYPRALLSLSYWNYGQLARRAIVPSAFLSEYTVVVNREGRLNCKKFFGEIFYALKNILLYHFSAVALEVFINLIFRAF